MSTSGPAEALPSSQAHSRPETSPLSACRTSWSMPQTATQEACCRPTLLTRSTGRWEQTWRWSTAQSRSTGSSSSMSRWGLCCSAVAAYGNVRRHTGVYPVVIVHCGDMADSRSRQALRVQHRPSDGLPRHLLGLRAALAAAPVRRRGAQQAAKSRLPLQWSCLQSA